MSRSLNKVLLIGNLTKDPVVRYSAKGNPVASFSIATNRSWVPADGGEKVDQVEFHNLVVWGKLAEICEKYLKKGDKAYFEGRLQTRKWDDDSGNTRYSTEIVVENMLMLGARGGGEGAFDDDFSAANAAMGTSASKATKKTTSKKKQDVPVADIDDIADDIPF